MNEQHAGVRYSPVPFYMRIAKQVRICFKIIQKLCKQFNLLQFVSLHSFGPGVPTKAGKIHRQFLFSCVQNCRYLQLRRVSDKEVDFNL